MYHYYNNSPLEAKSFTHNEENLKYDSTPLLLYARLYVGMSHSPFYKSTQAGTSMCDYNRNKVK